MRAAQVRRRATRWPVGYIRESLKNETNATRFGSDPKAVVEEIHQATGAPHQQIADALREAARL